MPKDPSSAQLADVTACAPAQALEQVDSVITLLDVPLVDARR